MRNVALDLGVRKIAFCEVENGRVKERRTVRTLAELDDVIGPGCAPARVAFEACREAWHVHEVVAKNGHEPLMIDTTRIKQIGINKKRKTDRIDAELQARAVENGNIPLAHVLSKSAQGARALLSVRRALIESRTNFVVTARGLVRAGGGRLPSCDAKDFVKRVRATTLDEASSALIAPLLDILESVERQIVQIDAKVERLMEKHPVITQLSTAPAIAAVTAASFVSVIDDPTRFRNAHQVGAYLGLVPSETTTGGKRRVGSITNAGNSYLRSLLVQAAWNVLRLKREDPLKSWAQNVIERRGKRVGVVALARRLAGVLWAMWRDGTAYHVPNAAQPIARGLRRQAKKTSRQADKIAAMTA